MLLWHMGTAAAITYVTLGRRRIDYRFVLLGAVLPDILDGALGIWFAGDRFVGHSLLMVIVVAVVVLVATRGETRLALFGLAVGWLLHLVTDAMWQTPQTFLWPAFGTAFPRVDAEPYAWELFTRPAEHIATWLGEAAGAALLAWFWVAFRLSDGRRRALFLHDGYLRP